jgi:hypothetical protein
LQRHIAHMAASEVGVRPEFQGVLEKEPKAEWAELRRTRETKLTSQIFNLFEERVLFPSTEGKAWRSILLFGPPGTGKTTWPEDTAKLLGWPLIRLSPSHFVAGGPSQVEARATRIFDALHQQANVVILFDEIDRLILDRNAKEYTNQEDIFQFMTPSMLVKIRDLRKRAKTIFFISTNYFERIDPAVRRPGRIDAQLLIPLPDREGRRKAWLAGIKRIHKATFDLRPQTLVARRRWDRRLRELQRRISSVSVLLGWEELNGAVSRIDSSTLQRFLTTSTESAADEASKTIVASFSEKPSVSLAGYWARMCDKNWAQLPSMEFFHLLSLALEGSNRYPTPMAADARQYAGRWLRLHAMPPNDDAGPHGMLSAETTDDQIERLREWTGKGK